MAHRGRASLPVEIDLKKLYLFQLLLLHIDGYNDSGGSSVHVSL